MAVGNSCQCIGTSGGVRCASHQIAICRSDGVTCRHECRDSISSDMMRTLTRRFRLDAFEGLLAPDVVALRQEWFSPRFPKTLLEAVTGLPAEGPPNVLVAALLNGLWMHPSRPHEVVTFKLPSELRRQLQAYQALLMRARALW